MRPADLQVYCLKTCPMLDNFEAIEHELERKSDLCIVQTLPGQWPKSA